MSKKQKIKHLKRYTKGGIDYCYFRPSNKRIMAEFGTAAFYVEFAKAEEQFKTKKTIPSSIGTFGHLLTEYKKSDSYTSLSVRTKEDYLKCHNYLQPIAMMPARDIDTPFIYQTRDKAKTRYYPRFANYVLSAMSAIFSYGIKYGHVSFNPVLGVERFKRDDKVPEVNRAWSEDEIKVMLTAPIHLRLPMVISFETGLRLGDVLTLTKNNVKDGWVKKRTNKSKFNVECPITDELQSVLDEAPTNDTLFICCSTLGKKWTDSGFHSSFGKFKAKRLEEGEIKPNLTFHGIRHTIGSRLKEKGLDKSKIAYILGDKTDKMADIYSRDAKKNNIWEEAHKALKENET